MTRSEAIRLLTDATSNKNWAECNVSMIDFFIKTGMLKVEEEKTVEEKLEEVIKKYPICHQLTIDDIIWWVREAGLKIVEKDK